MAVPLAEFFGCGGKIQSHPAGKWCGTVGGFGNLGMCGFGVRPFCLGTLQPTNHIFWMEKMVISTSFSFMICKNHPFETSRIESGWMFRVPWVDSVLERDSTRFEPPNHQGMCTVVKPTHQVQLVGPCFFQPFFGGEEPPIFFRVKIWVSPGTRSLAHVFFQQWQIEVYGQYSLMKGS